jgi:hypothetical protein
VKELAFREAGVWRGDDDIHIPSHRTVDADNAAAAADSAFAAANVTADVESIASHGKCMMAPSSSPLSSRYGGSYKGDSGGFVYVLSPRFLSFDADVAVLAPNDGMSMNNRAVVVNDATARWTAAAASDAAAAAARYERRFSQRRQHNTLEFAMQIALTMSRTLIAPLLTCDALGVVDDDTGDFSFRGFNALPVCYIHNIASVAAAGEDASCPAVREHALLERVVAADAARSVNYGGGKIVVVTLPSRGGVDGVTSILAALHEARDRNQ